MVEEGVEELLAEGKALVDEGRGQDVLFLLDELEKGLASSRSHRELSLLRMTCYAFMGRYSTVIETFERGDKDIRSDPETILTVAESYLEVGGASKARDLYARLKNKKLTGELEARLHRGLGRYYTFIGKYDLARKHYHGAIELSKKEGLYEMLGLCLMDIGAVELFCERWQETRRHFLEAMRYVRKDAASLARLYSNLALVYFMRSMHQMALQMLERTEVMYARSGNYVGLLKSLLNKGAMLHAIGDNDSAESMFLRAEEMSRRTGLKPMLVGALTNLSSVYLAVGRYDVARHDAEEAMRIATELKDERGRIAARNNLGLSLIRTKEARSGIRILEDNLKVSDRVGTFGLSADAMEMLSEGYLVLGKAKEARAYAKKVLSLARERGMANVVRRLNKSLKIKEALLSAKGDEGETSRTRRAA
jgi:tetratricopeptide (TPR) repeat protein